MSFCLVGWKQTPCVLCPIECLADFSTAVHCILYLCPNQQYMQCATFTFQCKSCRDVALLQCSVRIHLLYKFAWIFSKLTDPVWWLLNKSTPWLAMDDDVLLFVLRFFLFIFFAVTQSVSQWVVWFRHVSESLLSVFIALQRCCRPTRQRHKRRRRRRQRQRQWERSSDTIDYSWRIGKL